MIRVWLENIFLVYLGVPSQTPEAIFLASLRTSSFPAGNEAYGKSIESSFLARNELAPTSFPAWYGLRYKALRSLSLARNPNTILHFWPKKIIRQQILFTLCIFKNYFAKKDYKEFFSEIIF
jgi:hypothetical protein